MFCHQCGSEVKDGAAFCQKCGAKLAHTNDAQQAAGTKAINNGGQQEPVAAAAFAGQENIPKGPYGDGIKPYYLEEFGRIAAGQKPKFNWAAFFLNGWNQLYNGCTKIFCKTFLPLQLVLFAVSLLTTVGILKMNVALMAIGPILIMVVGVGALILNTLNGINFNRWYYQDVVSNPGKKRSRKWLWIMIVCEVAVIVFVQVLVPRILLKSLNDAYSADWLDEESYDYGDEYDYEEDAAGDEALEAGEDAADWNASGSSEEAVGDQVPEAETVAVDEVTESVCLFVVCCLPCL